MYGIVMPAAAKLDVVDALAIVSLGPWVALTVTLVPVEVTAPELALAVLVTLPASMSACESNRCRSR